MVTAYGLEGSGPNSGGNEIFRTQPPVQWAPGLFSGGKTAGAWRWYSPHQVPRQKKSTAIPLLPVWAFMTCSNVNFTFTFFSRHEFANFLTCKLPVKCDITIPTELLVPQPRLTTAAAAYPHTQRTVMFFFSPAFSERYVLNVWLCLTRIRKIQFST
jgi:hypothetical protein